eukprot:scaffold11725_cov116-Cylindrotheca_fusiformis.AAC.4
MSLSSLVCRQCRTAALASRNPTALAARRRPMDLAAARRRLQSTKPPSPPDEPPTLKNVALASALAGFCFFVFTYSMNAVGQADATDDPLAQLKEEAQEARQSKAQEHNRKLSKEEIAALESGMTGEYSESTEIAVAAPSDIADIEEEANRKVFKQKQEGEEKKKKPWWRFGF